MARLAAKSVVRAGFAAMALCFAVWAAARPATVADVVVLVRSGVVRKQADGSLARAVGKLELADRLDDRVVEELESLGAGPKTVEALLHLRDQSARMPPANPPPAFDSPPPPSPVQQAQAIDLAAGAAGQYLAGLPDFICEEWVTRFEDWGSKGRWREKDLLEIKLTYFDHLENYRLVTVNHRPVRADLDTVGGAHSEGEFGSLLMEIFRPGSHARFTWDHWTTLRKRKAHVFRYRIARENSDYKITFGFTRQAGEADSTTVGEHGNVYIDRDTGQTLRVEQVADSIPADFPVSAASTLLDYDFTSVGGRQFLLPLHAEVRLVSRAVSNRNEVKFRGYRKFNGESSITFETPGKP
jgi:hypothetical protein